MKTRKGKESIELGLAVSALSLREGEARTAGQIAAFCGVSRRAIEKIEQKALDKLRHRVPRDLLAQLAVL